MNGVPERLRHFVDYRRGDVELGGWIRLHLLTERFIGRAFAFDFLLQHEDAVEQTLWPWRTAGDVDVDRDDAVDALHDGVVVEHATARRARAHRDTPFGLGHLLPDATQHRRELERHSARANEQVGLARRKRLALHAEPCEVVVTCGSRHELDRAACCAERHGPERILTAPVHKLIELRRDPGFVAGELLDVWLRAWTQSHWKAPFFHT